MPPSPRPIAPPRPGAPLAYAPPDAPAPTRPRPRGGGWRDALLLLVAVAIAVGDLVVRLGAYGGDWTRLAAHLGPPIADPIDRVAALLRGEAPLPPVAAALEALLARLFDATPFGVALFGATPLGGVPFGGAPVGRHVATTLLGVAGAAMLCAALRELGVSRLLAVVVALLVALLPGDPDARFPLAAVDVALAMLLWAGSLHAELRAQRAHTAGWVAWRLAGALALTAALLAAEVPLPLVALHPLLAWLRARRLRADGAAAPAWRTSPLVLALPPAAAVAAALTLTRSLLGTAALGTPAVVAPALRTPELAWSLWPAALGAWSPVGAVRGLAVAALAYVYLLRIARRWEGRLPDTLQATRLALLGGAVILLATAPAVVAGWATPELRTLTLALGARSAMAASSIGLALLLAALAASVSTLPRWRRPRERTLAGVAALLAGIATYGLHHTATDWVEAGVQQRATLSALRAQLPTLPAGAAVLLGGVCPYARSAPLLASDRAARGAIRLLYHDPTLDAALVTPALQVELDGLRGELALLPYDRLLAVNTSRRVAMPLADEDAARRWLAVYDPTLGEGCPGR